MADLSQFLNSGGLKPVFYSENFTTSINETVTITPASNQALFLQILINTFGTSDFSITVNGGPNIVENGKTPALLMSDPETSGRPEMMVGFQFGVGEEIAFTQGVRILDYRYVLLEKG